MELTDEQLDIVIGGSQYSCLVKKWRKYCNESMYGRLAMPSGTPSSPCPQGAQQIGFLEKVGSDGRPLPRCVRDGATINEKGDVEEDFQQDVKKKHKRMKIRLIGKGGNKTKAAPYNKDPSTERSKSAPPGSGGVNDNR